MYQVKYRGGPKHNHKAVLPTLDNEIPMMTYKSMRLDLDAFDLYPTPMNMKLPVKRGVYSRVYTPTKNGVYLYVWVEQ